MALLDFHVLAQSLVYFIIAVFGLLIVITTSVTKSNFEGDCILYADFESEGSGSSLKVWMHGSAASKCDFPTYFSAFGLLVFGLIMGSGYMYAVIKSRRDEKTGSQMWVWPFLFLNAIIAFLTLVVACMLTVGFSSFCNGLLEFYPDGVECSHFQDTTWNRQYTGESYNVGSFESLMDTSIACSWLAFVSLLVQIGLCFLRVMRNRRNGNVPQSSPTKKDGPAVIGM